MISLSSSFLSRSAFVIVLAGSAACTVTTGSSPDAGDNSSSGGSSNPMDAGSGASTGDGPLPFAPSNGVDVSKADLSKATDELSLSGECRIDSDAGTIYCGGSSKIGSFAQTTVTLPDLSRVSLFVAKSIRVETSTTVRTQGALPIVFVALDDVAVLGSFFVEPGTCGGAKAVGSYSRGAGTGGGTAASKSGLAGGGGSFCGLGGRAGASGATAPDPSAAYGKAELVPLVAGSAGAVSFFSNDVPHGGGALHLIAGKSVVVAASGVISLPGSGGDRGSDQIGGPGQYGGGGGGSGGALLIEAPSVRVDGTLAANGGAGGGASNNAQAGAFGTDEAAAAKGGTGLNVGGDGSSSTTVTGGDGVWLASNPKEFGDLPAASGGGGGAGRIRINTSAGQATISGTISPAMTTPCATMGILGH